MATTVAELIARAREYADARDDGDDPYISDTALLYWLNQENRRLVRRVGRLGYVVNETATTFTTSTALTNVLAILGVYEASGTRFVPVPRLAEGHTYDSSRRFWRAQKGATGTVTVSVGQTGTYEVRYIPVPATLVLTGATPPTTEASVYYPAGWEETMVLGAALRAKAKEGSDGESPLLRQLYQDEWEDVEVEAANSDANTIVKNVDSQRPPGYPSNQGLYDWWWF